ncbi:endothelin-3b [Takifugu rubripes]|uniref:Endothelin-3 n=2 Tax=Takifugu TaxID=31032 RepID=A0A3B5KKA5_TAKRU|nr:endothelin-3-like [Takifugu rubripes]XP_056897435.1 endothelin-3b [Takifugu flavidus]TNM87235.1 hypothetical protein fugu_007465 [Takifugu bimaculatus]
MARIFSVLSKVMFFSLLGLFFLQGVFDAVVISEYNPGGLRVSRGAQTGLSLAAAGGSKTRSKRCTCYSYKDKECVYYCHLDIIWINTPERLVPYGMSSYRGPQRIRREVAKTTKDKEAESWRCACARPADPECQRFCQSSSLQRAPVHGLYRVTDPE